MTERVLAVAEVARLEHADGVRVIAGVVAGAGRVGAGRVRMPLGRGRTRRQVLFVSGGLVMLVVPFFVPIFGARDEAELRDQRQRQ